MDLQQSLIKLIRLLKYFCHFLTRKHFVRHVGQRVVPKVMVKKMKKRKRMKMLKDLKKMRKTWITMR